MLSNYQLKIADLCNILIGNVEKVVRNFFLITKSMCFHYENLQLYFRLRLKLKKIHHIVQNF